MAGYFISGSQWWTTVLVRRVVAALYSPNARGWATAAPRGRRRAPAKALALSYSREFGDAVGIMAPPAAAAGARSRTPVNQISDVPKVPTANQRNWRRHCAKSVTPMPAKRWQLFVYHTDLPEPLSLCKVGLLRRATAPYPERCIHREKKTGRQCSDMSRVRR